MCIIPYFFSRYINGGGGSLSAKFTKTANYNKCLNSKKIVKNLCGCIDNVSVCVCVSRHRAIKGKPHFHCISNKFVVSILFIGYQYNNIQNFNPRIILGLKPEFGSKMRVCMVWW